MPATPIASAVRYYRRGLSKVSWVPTIANKAAPTRAELNAGTELSVEVGAVEGWQIVSAVVETPSLGSKFDAKIDGAISADDSSLTLYASQTGTDVRDLLSRGTNGYVVWMDEGDTPGRKMDVFPVRVLSQGKIRNLEDAAQVQVGFAVTSEPAENVTIPA
ncbi:phage tail tube protein [Micromonospora parva]|uniref:phage tail tube protein n=1 Tax=Micromonospora parva TaxID=1464048 RepID=UPI0036558477